MKSKDVGLMFVQLVSKIFNLCGPDPLTSQTDGQTTCDRKTTLCTIVHCTLKTLLKQSAKLCAVSQLVSIDLPLAAVSLATLSLTVLSFYHTMHYSEKRGLAIAYRLSVCLYVTLVDHDHIG